MRAFIRHPIDIPIDLQIDNSLGRARVINLSIGGICCHCEYFLATGTRIDIRIPLTTPTYHGHGIVCWCKKSNPAHTKASNFEIGVTFADNEEIFRSRMVEQICQIEHYKNMVQKTQNRQLSSETAAQEWILQHAANFNQED